MLKRFLTSTAIATTATLCLAQGARAGVVTFDDRVIDPDGYATEANDFSEQGLSFAGLQFYFIPHGNPVVIQPNGYPTTFMETAEEPVVVTLTGGGVFDLLSLKLGLGDFNSGSSDTVLVTGAKANCSIDCLVSLNLTITNVFQTFDLAGFTGLSQVTFGQHINNLQQVDTGYLAFDDLAFRAEGDTAVPEPATWAMMLLGFGALGVAMRRRRANLATA